MEEPIKLRFSIRTFLLSLVVAGAAMIPVVLWSKGVGVGILGLGIMVFIVNVILAVWSQKGYEMKKKVEEFDSEIIEYRQMVDKLDSEKKELMKKVEEGAAAEEPRFSDPRHAELLLSISQALNQTLELRTLLSLTLTKVKELVGFHSGGIFLYNADKSELYVAATEGFYEAEIKLQLSPEIGIPAIVAQTNRPLVVPAASDPRFNRIRQSARVESAVYVPISLGKEIYGCIGLWSMEKNSYGQKHLELLQTVTAEAARAIRNADLYEKLDTRLNFIVSLWETSKSLASSVDISSATWEKVLGEVLASARFLFGAEKVVFFRYHKEKKSLEPYVVLGFSTLAQLSRDIVISSDSADINFLLRSTFQVKECRKDPRFAFFSNLAIRESLVSLLWSPLIGRQRIIGTLALFTSSVRSWTQEESQWLDIFGNMLSMTLENIFLLQDLFSEKNQLQVLIDNMPEGVFTTDGDGKILTWNIAASNITGWNLSEVSGKNCSLFVKCQTVDHASWCEEGCPSHKAMREGSKVDSGIHSVFVKNRQGVTVPTFITSAPIYNEEGKVAGSIVVFRDITKEKEIEQMKEDFLATITHDLRSPLASIMGYTELLLNPKLGEVSCTQKEFLEAILRSSKTLQILISNILESTRMEAGKAVYNMGLFNLEALLAELAEMFRPMTQHKHITMAVEIDENIIVYGDREKIKEIFINLFSNATKFTGERGTISTMADVKDGKVIVKVSDTGKGIPSKAISTLFQKFSQVKGEKGGTGLGLYIVKRILEAHGQEITVESVEGRGTTFTFTLDRFKPEERAPQADGLGAKILLIDKDRAFSEHLKSRLVDEGFEVFQAFNVDNALLLAQGDPPDVLVLDSKLPDLNLQLFHDQLKALRTTERIPVILVCEWREDVPPYIDAHLYKPIDHNAFHKKIRALLKARKNSEQQNA
jgi:PAS domain S-box-containing protein